MQEPATAQLPVTGEPRAAAARPASEFSLPTPPRGQLPALFGEELAQPGTLGIGRVAKNVAEQLPELEALGDVLAPHLAELGFDRALPVVARDNEEMAVFLEKGIVDLVSETPLSAIGFTKDAGATLLLLEKRQGRDRYRSVIFVRADSPLRTLDQLGGHRIAFEDSGSTSAFLLPLASLLHAGLAARPLENPAADAPSGVVGYFFARSESAIVSAVRQQAADAGAISDADFRELEQSSPELAASLRVIDRSRELPRAFLLAGPRITPAQRERLRTLLLAMSADEAGREALRRYAKVDRFESLETLPAGQIQELERTWSLVHAEPR